MKIDLLRCWFKNVLPFGNVEQEVTFTSGVYKITGVNKDKGGSNGAGKTSIMNIISFVLYGKPFDPAIEDIQNYTNNSKKTPATMGVEFRKGTDLFKIIRTKAGSTNSVTLEQFQEDEWHDITLGKGIQATNSLIVDIIGMSFDMFCLTCIFSGNVQPFLMRSVAEQRSIIETLFDASELTEYADLAKTKKSQIETEIRIQEALQKSINDQKSSLQSKINDARIKAQNWEKEKTNKLASFSQLQQRNIDYASEREIFSDIAEINNALVQVRFNKQKLSTSKQQITTNLGKIERELSHVESGNCPFCKQAFTSPEKIEVLRAEVTTLKNEIEGINEQLKLVQADESEFNSSISIFTDLVSFKTLNELDQHERQVNESVMNRSVVEQSTNPFTELISNLQEMSISDFDVSILDGLRSDLEHVKLLIQLLTNRDSIVRTSIISSQTSLLNSRIQHYSNMLDLPQVLHFDSNMKCSVMEFGRTTGYGNLSAGEKRRANLSLSYAFRDLVTLRHGGLNILLMDEIDGGSLDAPAGNSIIKSVFEVCGADTIWVITHNELIAQKINNEITVVKECGFSTIRK